MIIKITFLSRLRNLPITITSLCNVHGISISQTNIHLLSQQCEFNTEDCYDVTNTASVKKVHFDLNKRLNKIDKPITTSSTNKPAVQCWLCDGPHTFQQCSELTRMKNICAKRPQVQKHFRQLLLNRNAGGIKVLLDAPDLFDDDNPDDNVKHDHTDDENEYDDGRSEFFTSPG
mmetsp:Transcript_14774/g.27803  ORF Transcript_14774/g.27803 Transcript_14774/m.27803 type:complete len:174 (-) Transcript_14774:869-1390(-)